jgi:hypothetical protein
MSLNDKCGVTDEVISAVGYNRCPNDRVGIIGHVVAELFGPDGKLKQREETHNLMTTLGDIYVAQRMYSTQSLITPWYMKTGTGSTAVDKASSGSFIADAQYNDGSAIGMVSTYPKAGASANVATFQCLWPATAGYVYTIRRVSLTDNNENAGDTVESGSMAIALFGADIPKEATDTLTVTWNMTFAGYVP